MKRFRFAVTFCAGRGKSGFFAVPTRRFRRSVRRARFPGRCSTCFPTQFCIRPENIFLYLFRKPKITLFCAFQMRGRFPVRSLKKRWEQKAADFGLPNAPPAHTAGRCSAFWSQTTRRLRSPFPKNARTAIPFSRRKALPIYFPTGFRPFTRRFATCAPCIYKESV